jgi:hypothetical protein
MEFSVNLSGGRTAKLFCGNRMTEATVRPALSDPRIGSHAHGPCIIAFMARHVGNRPLQAEVIQLSKVEKVGRRSNGDAALLLKDGNVATITVAPEDFQAAQQLLAQLLAAPPAGNSRLFFAQIEGKLELVNAADIRKRTKAPRPDSRSMSCRSLTDG